MIAADLRPMSSAPLDGTPVRLFASIGSAIASFWTEEPLPERIRSRGLSCGLVFARR